MFSREEYNLLYPKALDWAQRQESTIMQIGIPLSPRQLERARAAGVQQPENIRLLAVDKVTPPEDPALRAAAQRANIITPALRGISFGYGLMLRVDAWGDEELLAHIFVHIGQFERAGDLASFMTSFFSERLDPASFGIGPLELEARNVARRIVSGKN